MPEIYVVIVDDDQSYEDHSQWVEGAFLSDIEAINCGQDVLKANPNFDYMIQVFDRQYWIKTIYSDGTFKLEGSNQ